MKLSKLHIAIIISSVVTVLLLFIIFPVSSIFIPTKITQVSNVSPNIQNGPIVTGSIVNTTKIIIPQANVTAVTQLLDQAGCNTNQGICSASSPKLTINVQANLLDSNQNPILSSVYIPIPTYSLVPQSWFAPLSLTKLALTPSGTFLGNVKPLSLTDSQGHDITLGSVQVGFYGVVPQDSTILATGDYVAMLDDHVEQAGHFVGNGMTQNQQLLFAITGLPSLTFTFSDELKTVPDGSQHVFSIKIGNVTATVQNGKTSNQFQLTKTALAYVLVMTVNQQKQTVIGANNQAIAVFKSDDAVVTTFTNQSYGDPNTFCHNFDGGGYAHCNPSLPPLPAVSATTNGFPIPINMIPRNSNVVITVNGQHFTEITPITQQTYTISCTERLVSGQVYSDGGIDANTYADESFTIHCTSNFGFTQ